MNNRKQSGDWKVYAVHASGIGGLWLLVYITRWFMFGYEPAPMSRFTPPGEVLTQFVLPYLWLGGLGTLAYKFKINNYVDMQILSALALACGLLTSRDTSVFTMCMRSTAFLGGFGLIRFAFLLGMPPKPRPHL